MQSQNKSVIITGGNTGLGYYCAKHIAMQGHQWHIILACRNEEKAQIAVLKMIAESGNPNISFLSLDLASLKSVRNFVDSFVLNGFPALHGIICNAGMAGGDNYSLTEDGIETTFQVNCLGHFLLVQLMLKYLVQPARIIFVSSELHRNDGIMKSFRPVFTNALQLAYPQKAPEFAKLSGQQRYSTSKLGLLFYMHELAFRISRNGFDGIKVNAFNPGLMPDTGLGGLNKKILRKFFLKYILPIFVKDAVSTPDKSGKILAELFTSDNYADNNGRYFDREKEKLPSAESLDKIKSLDLWNTSVELAGLKNNRLIP